MTAAGDVHLEMALRVTVRGTVKELAALMEMLNASSAVADIASELPPGGNGCEAAYELCERLGVRAGRDAGETPTTDGSVRNGADGRFAR